jgi:hypothetical protein
MAKDIHQQCLSRINNVSMILVEYLPISKEWADHFIQRHPFLKMAFAR